MGFELISRDNTTPQRLFALLQLARALKLPPHTVVLNSVQPSAINDKQDSQEVSERLYRVALAMGLIKETGSREREVELLIEPASLSSFDEFRKLMQSRVLGTTDESQDHFLLNQFTAWYAVQDTQVLGVSRQKIEQKFNEEMYGSAETVKIRDKPGLNAWLIWAEFLGWGWQFSVTRGSEMQFMPDATTRIMGPTAQLLSIDDHLMKFGRYLRALVPVCPELDGGILFEQCWQASRGNEVRGNRLSLMLSTALRTLHNLGTIELINRPDATETWTLFPAQSHIGRVSHIRRKAAA